MTDATTSGPPPHDHYAFHGRLTIAQAERRRASDGWVVCETPVEYVPGLDGTLAELAGAPTWHGEIEIGGLPLGTEFVVATPHRAGRARVCSTSSKHASFTGTTPLRRHDETTRR